MGATPPAFNPPNQQSGSKLWLWLLLIVIAFCILVMVALFFSCKAMMNTGMSMVSCAMNGDLARNAVLAYAQEHDGVLPNAETWQDDVRANYERLYQKAMGEMSSEDMPSWLKLDVAKPGEVLGCSMGGTKTGFAFNSEVSGKKLSDFTDPKTTVLIFETLSPAYNAYGLVKDRPTDDPALKFFGEKREWMDFHIEGESDMFESGNSDFDFDIKPEDGLPGKGNPGGTPNQEKPTTS